MTRAASGFSLVECALAIAIAAVALVTLVAVLPAGLRATSDGNLQSAEAAIIARIRQQAADQIPSGNQWFDAAGFPLDAVHVGAVFAARIELKPPLELPGGDGVSLRHIQIAVGDGSRSDPFADPHRVRHYQLLLAPTAQEPSP